MAKTMGSGSALDRMAKTMGSGSALDRMETRINAMEARIESLKASLRRRLFMRVHRRAEG